LYILGAGEDRLYEVAPTAANDPQLLPHPPKKGWWTMAMAKSQIPMVHWVHDNMDQELNQYLEYCIYRFNVEYKKAKNESILYCNNAGVFRIQVI